MAFIENPGINIRRPFGAGEVLAGAGGVSFAGAAGGIRGVSPAVASTVFVEVGQASTSANITRGGVKLPDIAVNPEIVGSFLGDLHPIATHIVSQSIAAGTSVARGTAIDIVLAPGLNLPIGVIEGVHPGLAGFTVEQVSNEFLNADVRDILRRRSDAADLTTTERDTLTTTLTQQGIPIADDGTNTLAAAFKGLQGALTFGS